MINLLDSVDSIQIFAQLKNIEIHWMLAATLDSIPKFSAHITFEIISFLIMPADIASYHGNIHLRTREETRMVLWGRERAG